MSLPLERVVYGSRATSPHAEAMMNLVQVLAVSQRNNARDEITGALALSRGRFFQAIEGRPGDLDRLLARLQADPRHEAVDVVDRRPIDARLFGEWAMVAPTVTPGRAAEIDRVVEMGGANPDEAVRLLHDLVSRDPAS
jgi:hypothetical protein